jgi:hypothetical protein
MYARAKQEPHYPLRLDCVAIYVVFIKLAPHMDLLWLASHALFMLIEIHGRQHLCTFIAKLLVATELSRDLGVAFLK